MDIKIISSDEFITNEWSGGSTTQLFIYPEGSVLANRDFEFRISSATFTSTESKFSDFSSYQRYILPLNGELSVDHKGLYSRELSQYEVEYFSGSWDTYSTNSLDCRDFNFIAKDESQVNLAILENGDCYVPKRDGMLMLFSQSECEIKIADSSNEVLSANSLMVIEEEGAIYKIEIINSNAPVIICEYRR